MTYNPMTWIHWAGEFFFAWATTFPRRKLLPALPALSLLLLTISGLIVFGISDTDWRYSSVVSQLEAAHTAEDYPTAELLLRRLLAARGNDPNLLYSLAVVRDRRGASDEARELMITLSKSSQGSLAARWLIANHFSQLKWAELDANEKIELGRLLAMILDKEREDPNPNILRLYALCLLETQQPEAAIPVLEALAKTEPVHGLRAAVLANQLGQRSKAEQLAKRSLYEVGKLLKQNPGNTSYALAVADSQILLERPADAVQTLKRAIDLASTEEEKLILKRAMGNASLLAILAVEKEGRYQDDGLQILKLLQAALQVNPNHRGLNTLMLEKVLASSNSESEEIASVRNALVAAAPPGIAHFIKGTVDLNNDRIEEGIAHLKLASERVPNSGAVLNNLAFALANHENSDLEEALRLSTSAIENVSNPVPSFYETRGQILLKLHRYEEAILDFEKALDQASLAIRAHTALAVCYDAIGKLDLAKQHREQALKLKGGLSES